MRAGADGRDDSDSAGPDGDRANLFEAVHALLEAADVPVLLVIEDAHWADQSTRDLVGFLFTRPFAHPVAVVASYRSDDHHRRHPLRRQVAEWSRIPSVDRLAFSPLPEHSARALVRELAPERLEQGRLPRSSTVPRATPFSSRNWLPPTRSAAATTCPATCSSCGSTGWARKPDRWCASPVPRADVSPTTCCAGVEMDILGRCGDTVGALAAYDDVVGLLGQIWDEHFAGRVRLAAQASAAIASGIPAATAAERRGLVQRADQLLVDGHTVAERFRAGPSRWGVEGRMWEARLRAEHLRVRWLAGEPVDREELLTAWVEAVERTTKLGHVPEEARVRASYSQILQLVAEGRSNGEIGKQLFIATKTVSVHVSNILGKLGAASRTEAAAIARRDRLLS